MNLGCLISILVLPIACVIGDAAWSWHNFPNPQAGDGKCGLPTNEKSWICDPKHLLGDADNIRQLDREIALIFNTTECPCSQFQCDEDRQGYSFAVALVPSIQEVMTGVVTEGMEITDNIQLAQVFAVHTYKKWNVGKCDNYVLIVYSPMNGSGVVFTMTGTTTAMKLTNNDVVQITSQVRHYFIPNPGSLFQGLRKMMLDYKAVLNGDLVMRPPITAQPVVGGGASGCLPHILGTIATTILAFLLTYASM